MFPAHISGYSRLMGEAEAATVRDLKARQSVVLPMVGRYGGRIIDTAGYGILAEFPSVINATECAVEVQTIMAVGNERIPAPPPALFPFGTSPRKGAHPKPRVTGAGLTIGSRRGT